MNESESDACVRCAYNVFVCSNNDFLYCTQNTPFGAYCGAYCVLNIGAVFLIKVKYFGQNIRQALVFFLGGLLKKILIF